MRSFILSFSLITISMLSFSQISEFGFRKAKWGMSINQVKSTETNINWQTTDISSIPVLLFKTEIAAYEAFAVYYFLNGRFEKGMYIITEKHSNKTEYVQDYNNLKKILTNKYGKPTTDDHFWKNDLYKDDPQDYGMAVSVGHLRYYTFWESATVTQGIIMLTLMGDNYKIELEIGYESPTFKKALEEFKKVIEEDVF